MRIDIITVLPEMLEGFVHESILARAEKKGLAEIHLHNLRDYSKDKWRRVDDYPFGGQAGMVMQIEPIDRCISALKAEREYDEVIFTSPDGELFNQKMANDLSLGGNLIILAGHYKGVDQRVREHLITKEISVGDFVLTSAAYSFSKAAFPLFNYAQISIKPTTSVRNPEKLYVAMRNSLNASGPASYCGGTYANGWVIGRMREMASVYFLASDETAPTITEQNRNPRNLTFKVTDTGSGLQDCKAYLDGKFILLQFGKNKEIFFCDLTKTPVQPTDMERTLKIIATDNRNNKKEYLTKIKY